MLPALFLIAALLTSPALAEETAVDDPTQNDAGQNDAGQDDAGQENAFGGVPARLALAHGLVEDLLEQYALAAEPWDPEISPPEAGALPHWTVPVADEAARAVGALVWLRPEEADPLAVARARDALAAVYDNLAWDALATERALVDLGAALEVLAARVGGREWDAQQAADPQAPSPDDAEPIQGYEVPP